MAGQKSNTNMSSGRNARPIQFCFSCLAADEIGVWECCSAYKGIVEPGCQFLGPNFLGLCISVRSVSTRVIENNCKCETKTKDNVFVTVTVAVQQVPIRDLVYDAIYKLDDPNQQVMSYVADVVRSEVPKMTLDEVFENKDAIAHAVSAKITDPMKNFGYKILQALVTEVEPDAKVKKALNNVEAAAKDRIAQETLAEAEYFVAVKKASGEAESKALQGQGIARQRRAIVEGLRESIGFEGGPSSAKDISELLLITQYFDTLEKISEGKGNTLFIPHTVGGISDMASQVRNGILQGSAAGVR